MALSEILIDEAVRRYGREIDRYRKLAEFVAEICHEIISGDAIRASVVWRAKDEESFKRKMTKWLVDPNHHAKADKISSVDDIFGLISDLAGVRITSYVESDRERIVNEICKKFIGPGSSGVSPEKKDGPDTLYRATHCQVYLKAEFIAGSNRNLGEVACEIQVCSLLAHAWNEIDHDLNYKPLTGALGSSEIVLIKALSNQMLAGDGIIEQLLTEVKNRQLSQETAFSDEYDFVARMKDKFKEVTYFQGNAKQLFDELSRYLKIDSPKRVTEKYLTNGYYKKAMDIIDNVNAYVKGIADDTSMDPNSSDVLLALVLEKEADQILLNHAAGQGKGRPPRIASVARRYRDMRQSKSA